MPEVVNPTIFNKEILMSIADLKQESSYFRTFLSRHNRRKNCCTQLAAKQTFVGCQTLDSRLLFDGDVKVELERHNI